MMRESEGPCPSEGTARETMRQGENRRPLTSPSFYVSQDDPDTLPGALGRLAHAYLARERRGFAVATHRFGWRSRQAGRAREGWSAALSFWHTVRAEGAGP
jgi:hypothetical protein